MQKNILLKFNIHSDIKNKANKERKRYCLKLINRIFKQKPMAKRILNAEKSEMFPFKSETSQGCPTTVLFNIELEDRQLNKK